MKGTIGTTTQKPPDLREMSFLDHLDDLRKAIVHSALAFALAMIICWLLSGQILDFLTRPLPVPLIFTDPVEAFMVRVRISLVGGLMLAFPFILFRVWAFVAPGLFAHERSKAVPLIISSSALFYAGIVFCYVVLIPIVLEFFLSYQTSRLNPMISVESYFSFVARMCFGSGVVFQLPIAILVMSLLGMVTPAWLLKRWRQGVLIICVVAAVFTPSQDAISMIAMVLPVLVLYAASIVIAFLVVRKKRTGGGDTLQP